MKLLLSDDLLVSVIIPTYKRPERLRQLLPQLLVQEAAGISYEIIIVDDGSPEPVAEMVQAIATETMISVRCLRQANAGPAVARNTGAQAARGEYLLFVDDDSIVRPDFIRGHLETQLTFGPALVNCEFIRQTDVTPAPFRRWYESHVAIWEQVHWEGLKPLSEDVFATPHPAVTSANMSVRRIDFEQIGGFDQHYPFGCEDQDLGSRLGHAGMQTLLTRKTKVIHVEMHNTLPLFCRRQQMGARDTVRFIRRFAVSERWGEPAIAATNGPLRLGNEPWAVSGKKILRQVFAARFVSALPFALVSLCERICPEAKLLQHLYSLVVGAYLQKGWREGLKLYQAELPLPEYAMENAK